MGPAASDTRRLNSALLSSHGPSTGFKSKERASSCGVLQVLPIRLQPAAPSPNQIATSQP